MEKWHRQRKVWHYMGRMLSGQPVAGRPGTRQNGPGGDRIQVAVELNQFRYDVRLLIRNTADDFGEEIFMCSKARGNRLARLAVVNKFAGGNGVPNVCEHDARRIAQAPVGLRGIYCKRRFEKHAASALTMRPAVLML